MAGGVGKSGSPPPEEAAQDAAPEGLEERALARASVSEQLELDAWLGRL